MKRSIELKTGCSGYYNRHWKKIFYPEKLPQNKWFEYYCSRFSTVELNTTFYRFPTAESLEVWYKNSPEGFLISVKAHKLITHSKRFKDCKKQIDDFYLACEEGLKEKLGCVLFQLPPTIQYSEEKLQQIISGLNPKFKNVIEFRHPGWWTKKVYDELARHQIIFCTVSHPAMPEAIIANTSTVYVRLHGVPEMFYSGYDPEYLAQMHQVILKKRNVKEGYIYFNNTAGVEGVVNAIQFKKLIEEG
ncbi:MAG: DUF72 domain-containing protein [Ferruginibacter sp.]